MTKTKKITPQERRLMDRLEAAEKILKDILESDGGAYDLEPRQSYTIMAWLGGDNSMPATPAQMERAAGRVWLK